MKVSRQEDGFTLDAAIVAEGLGLDPGEVLPAMREGRLTSLCERGTGEDEGRNRLTFFHARRLFSVIVDDAGNVLERREATAKKKKARPAARLPR